MSVEISFIPKECIALVEDQLRPLIRKLEPYLEGRFDEDSLVETLKGGSMDLWVAVTDNDKIIAIQITQVQSYPLKKVLFSLFTAGENMALWADKMTEALVDIARENGCSSIEGRGRPGWRRFLNQYGFNFLCSTVERKV
jgi:hypothetical protein